jgi:integrase
MAEGIAIRHSRSCTSRVGGRCNCTPTYQAHVWSKRDNKRIRKTFPTLSAAKGWRADAMKGLRDGKLRAPTATTIRAAGEALIAGMEDGSIRTRSGKPFKPSARRSYEASLKRHIYPAFGSRKQSDVLYPDWQGLVDELAAQGLDGSTIKNALMPIRVLYRRARHEIPVNPTTGLEFPAPGNKQRRAVSAEVAARMLEALPPEDRAIRATSFYAGLRSGELQALSVEDVELFPDGGWGLIHVRRSWDKHEGETEPKSAAGARTVPVPGQLFDILDEHLLRLGRTSGLIFGRSAETPFSYSGVRARAMRVLKDAGIEKHDLQLHECRHTYRTLLADAGIPRDRRDRYSGHADNTVGGRYEHQLEHQYLDDSQTLTDYLTRADTPTRLRDNCATVSDSPERSGAVESGSHDLHALVQVRPATAHGYGESESGSGGGGI